MDARPSFEEIYMNMASLLSKRSTCIRLKVGTVITSSDFRQVLALGYNGNAEGLENKCDSSEPGKCGCIHSETNAIINCSSPRDVSKIVFVSHAPCIMCSKQFINLGSVKILYFNIQYRDMKGVELLKKTGIIVTQLTL